MCPPLAECRSQTSDTGRRWVRPRMVTLRNLLRTPADGCDLWITQHHAGEERFRVAHWQPGERNPLHHAPSLCIRGMGEGGCGSDIANGIDMLHIMCDATSMMLTWLPGVRNANAGSTPIAPPPMIARWCGARSISTMPSLVSARSAGRPGTESRRGRAPVAIMMWCAVRMRLLPSDNATAAWCGAMMCATRDQAQVGDGARLLRLLFTQRIPFLTNPGKRRSRVAATLLCQVNEGLRGNTPHIRAINFNVTRLDQRHAPDERRKIISNRWCGNDRSRDQCLPELFTRIYGSPAVSGWRCLQDF